MLQLYSQPVMMAQSQYLTHDSLMTSYCIKQQKGRKSKGRILVI